MKIPFTKAHGAHNDFLLTWKETISQATPEIARAICERHTGVGADGWILVERGRGQCDAANYAYPWHDNFCEPRAYTTPLCPSGQGHQGQDIRPPTCEKAKWVAVAVENGVISQIGTYTVYLSGDSGRTYLYLHMQMDQLKVRIGEHVERGQPIGYVSNNFGKTSTTIHLHFEIKEPVTRAGTSLESTWRSILRATWMPPLVQRCCCDLNAIRLSGSSESTA